MKAVTGKQLCKILEKKGWLLDHVSGSHHVMVLEGRSPVSVPVHSGKTLGKGLQVKPMKAAGLSERDL